jgi:sortase A
VTVLRRVTGLVGDLLVTVGVLLLLFVVWQLWWTDVAADGVARATVQGLERQFEQAPGGGSGAFGGPVVPGRAFAVVRIPRLGPDWVRPVLEGTGRDVLQRGVGHYVGTALPGQVGNFAVAGHRTTYGRPFHDIDRLRAGDLVVVQTVAGWSVYAVRSHVVVAPSAVEVLAPVPGRPGVVASGAWMTLTACHPKYSAAQRFVVFAQLVGSYSRAQGLPAGLLGGT